MAGTITGTVEGLQPIIDRMKGFKDGVKNRGLKRGITKGTRIVAKSAKANVNTATARGNLKKSIGLNVGVKGGAVVGKAGPRHGFKIQIGVRVRGGKKSNVGDPIYEDPAKIAHLVEFGHGGPHRAPAHPFMRPAWDATKGLILPIIAAEIDVEIGKQAAKSVG